MMISKLISHLIPKDCTSIKSYLIVKKGRFFNEVIFRDLYSYSSGGYKDYCIYGILSEKPNMSDYDKKRFCENIDKLTRDLPQLYESYLNEYNLIVTHQEAKKKLMEAEKKECKVKIKKSIENMK